MRKTKPDKRLVTSATVFAKMDVPTSAMRKTKPKKRLVSKEEYQQVMRAVNARRTLGLLLLLLGESGMIITVLLMFLAAGSDDGDWIWSKRIVKILTASALLGLPSVIFLKSSRRVYERADQIVSTVIPITNQNAHLLPAQELLRGSNPPPTVQRAELLRATQAKQETPQEQLLRSTGREE